MEFTNNPRSVTPDRPMQPGGQPRPMLQRRVFNDFGPRPSAPTSMPMRPTTNPAPPAKPVPRPSLPPAPASRPATPSNTPVSSAPYVQRPTPTHASNPQVKTAIPTPHIERPRLEEPSEHHSKKATHVPHTTAHAGLAGTVCFIVLAGLLLSPLVPGKVLDNFPLSSQSTASGDQSLPCISELHNSKVTESYTLKLGSPIVYKYNTSTAYTGDCNGKNLSATGNYGGQFNPLGLLVDLALALGISIAFTYVWRKVFGDKD